MPASLPKRLKIAIATPGRFHVLDLARELDALGQDVKFYSYVPRGRAASFGLPMHCHVSLLPRVAPYVAWQQLKPDLWPDRLERGIIRALDRAVIARLEPCDVFICMSGIFLEAARYAKNRFGARIFLERGSRHIHSQREILAGIDGARGPSEFSTERELAGYEIADRIVVPSSHVAESFERDPRAHAKLFRNPYGVELTDFPQRRGMPPGNAKTVLFVGAWSYRKGVDLLTAAMMQIPQANLQHVGGLGDVPFPDHPRFRHHDSVSQLDLAGFYGQAHVFAIASREEGLALVQAQALACGLPLVCTDRTGGADLAHSAALSRRITVVPNGDVAALKTGIEQALEFLSSAEAVAPLPEPDRQLLSWKAYGERYLAELLSST